MLKQKPNLSSSELKKSEKKNIEQIKQLLSSAKCLPRLVNSTGEEVVLTESVYKTLYNVLEAMESGTGISISPVDRDITMAEVSEILNISIPYLTKLLDQGDIPYVTVGSTRHLNLRDVLNYKSDRDQNRRKGISNLTAFIQEEGFYD